MIAFSLWDMKQLEMGLCKWKDLEKIKSIPFLECLLVIEGARLAFTLHGEVMAHGGEKSQIMETLLLCLTFPSAWSGDTIVLRHGEVIS